MNNLDENDNETISSKLKNFLFIFFQSINSNYYTSTISYNFSYYYGIIIMFLSSLQISSLIRFHLQSEKEIDEFEKDLNIFSTFLHYPIYLIRPKLNKDFYYSLEIILYIFSSFLLFNIIICILILRFQKKNVKLGIKTFCFTILYHLFILLEFVLFIPILIILYNSMKKDEETYKNVPLFNKIFHSILIFLYIILVYIIDNFNLLSSIINNNIKGFFNDIKSNQIIINYYFLQLLSFLFTMIISNTSIFLFFAYILLFFIISKIIFDMLTLSILYSRDFITIYILNIAFIVEQYIVSIVNKYTIDQFNSKYKNYNIGGLICIICTYVILKKIYFKYLDKYSLNYSLNSMRNIRSNYFNQNIICLIYIKSKFIVLIFQRKKTIFEINNILREIYLKFYPFYRYNFDFCLSYILFIINKYNNYELALTEIETTKKYTQLNLSQEFLLFLIKDYATESIRRRSEIENKDFLKISNDYEFIENNEVNKNVLIWSISNISNVIQYDKLSLKFKNIIFNSIEKKRQLWNLVENDDIIIEELYENGKNFFNSSNEVKNIWEKLNKISNENVSIELTKLYCDYLLKILDDRIESEFILDKISYNNNIKFSKYNDEIQKNKYKSDTGVIMIEGNVAINIGKIIYINQSLIKILGYQNKNELLGNNISMIIPCDIGRYHDDIINNYFKSGKSEILKKTLNILAMKSKEKYLLPIYILFTFMPGMKNKLQGVGLIRLRNKKEEMIICSETGMIEAITINMAKLLNITPNLIEKNNYYLQTFFPELMKIDKLDDDKMPEIFKEKYLKKINSELDEIKIEICCPKFNLIDKNIYRIKTKNVFIQNLTTNSFFNDSMILNNPANQQTNMKNSDKKLNNLLNNQKHTLISLNGEKLLNLEKTLVKSSNVIAGLNNLKFTSNKTQLKKTPDIDLIKKYKKIFLTHRAAIEKDNPNSKNLLEKIYDIYNSMLSDHELHQLTEKAEIVIKHLGWRIYKTIPIRIIIIDSDQLFEDKKEDNILYNESEINVEEKKYDNLIKDEKFNQNRSEHSQEMDKLYEIGSVSGKDINISLQKYLKQIKKVKYNNYTFYKIIGILIAIIIILSTILVILLTNNLFNFSKNYILLIAQNFSLNEYMLNIEKYSLIIYLKNIFDISKFEKFENEIEPEKMLIQFTKNVLDSINIYFGQFKLVFNNDEYNEIYGKNMIDYQFYNQLINFSFLNVIYYLLQNSVNLSISSLIQTKNNCGKLLNKNFQIIKENFNKKFNNKINFLFYSSISILLFSIIMVFLLLILLFFKYKNKIMEQNETLSIYEFIKNEEIEKIIKKIDSYEKKYNIYFKKLDDYKKKKIKFSNKNTEILKKRLKKKFLKLQKIEENKKNYNVISGKKPEKTEIENNKKNLMIRENMTIRYLLTFLSIFSFVLIYSLFYLIEIIYFQSIINSSKKITTTLFLNRFSVNYISYQLFYFIYRETILIHRQINLTDLYEFSNKIHNDFHKLSSYILNNKKLFNKNITDIFSNDLCDIFDNLTLCNYEELNATQNKGFKSLLPYYLNSVNDAISEYKNNYVKIENIKTILPNEKLCLMNFLMENIFIIYNEIFYQLNYKLNKRLDDCIFSLIIVCVIFGLLFLISIIYRLSSFIDKMKEEEMLSNKLITEIPYELLEENANIKNKLAGNFTKERRLKNELLKKS